MNNHPFDTLIKGNATRSYDTKWYPQSVSDYKKVFKIENNEALLKNIAYNMQYLEFLEKELEELDPSTVLKRMLTKTYVITSASIIEGLFLNLVQTKGWNESKKIRFVKLIDILDEKCKENNVDTSITATIHQVRELRNRIHLQKTEDDSISDHDYNAFTEDVKQETQELLYRILISPEISNVSIFNFLKPTETITEK